MHSWRNTQWSSECSLKEGQPVESTHRSNPRLKLQPMGRSLQCSRKAGGQCWSGAWSVGSMVWPYFGVVLGKPWLHMGSFREGWHPMGKTPCWGSGRGWPWRKMAETKYYGLTAALILHSPALLERGGRKWWTSAEYRGRRLLLVCF